MRNISGWHIKFFLSILCVVLMLGCTNHVSYQSGTLGAYAFIPCEDISRLRGKADSGDAESQFRLAAIYYGGCGVVGDEEKGLDWLLKAAQGDHPVAELYLGRSYALGRNGVKQDSKLAIYWYQKSASHGNLYAQYYLAEPGNGWSMPPSLQLKFAEKGMPYAEYTLARAYNEGRGEDGRSSVDKRDIVKAVFWATRSAEHGEYVDAEWLAAIYAGDVKAIFPPDPYKAYVWASVSMKSWEKDRLVKASQEKGVDDTSLTPYDRDNVLMHAKNKGISIFSMDRDGALDGLDRANWEVGNIISIIKHSACLRQEYAAIMQARFFVGDSWVCATK